MIVSYYLRFFSLSLPANPTPLSTSHSTFCACFNFFLSKRNFLIYKYHHQPKNLQYPPFFFSLSLSLSLSIYLSSTYSTFSNHSNTPTATVSSSLQLWFGYTNVYTGIVVWAWEEYFKKLFWNNCYWLKNMLQINQFNWN